jgi:hypothetical protein
MYGCEKEKKKESIKKRKREEPRKDKDTKFRKLLGRQSMAIRFGSVR